MGYIKDLCDRSQLYRSCVEIIAANYRDVLVMRNSEPAQRKALRLALDEMSKGLKEVEGEERADG